MADGLTPTPTLVTAQQFDVPSMPAMPPMPPPAPVAPAAMAALPQQVSTIHWLCTRKSYHRGTSIFFIIILVLVLLILFFMWFSKKLSRRLARAGWIVYYRYGCGYCTKQKEVLNNDFKQFIECDQYGNIIAGYTTNPPISCSDPNIQGFPFWYNTRTGAVRFGLQDTSALEQMSSTGL